MPARRPELSPEEAVRLQSGVRDAVSDEDLEEAAHFAKYAFAAYGYMLYVWSRPQLKCAPGAPPNVPRPAECLFINNVFTDNISTEGAQVVRGALCDCLAV